jgi:hypothetical protein
MDRIISMKEGQAALSRRGAPLKRRGAETKSEEVL